MRLYKTSCNRHALWCAAFWLLLIPSAHPQCPPAYWVDGESAGDEFGHRLDYVGDVNNDGYGDFIVGTWLGGSGELGYIKVLSGIDGSVIEKDSALVNFGSDPDIFGSAVAGGGDLNGNGSFDFAVAAERGCGSYINQGDNGYVYCADGASPFPGINSVCGTFAGQVLGNSIEIVQDISGDQVADLLIGSIISPSGGILRGRIFAYSPLLDAMPDTSLFNTMEGVFREYGGTMDSTALGVSLAPLGDVDGDSIPDFVAGAPGIFWVFPPLGTGMVFVFSGAADDSVIWSKAASTPGTLLGHDVARIADVDGDDIDDVVVSEILYGTGSPGRVLTFSGANGDTLWSVVGPNPGGSLGYRISEMPDLDGDGVNEVAAGSPFWGAGRGRVYVYSGQTGSPIFQFTGEDPSDAFGWDVANGDLNGDGHDDLIVGAKNTGSQGPLTGRVYVYFFGDGDGDGTEYGCDNCPLIYNLGNIAVKTGDLSGDGSLTSADIIGQVNYVFKSAPEPAPCAAIADVNCSGVVTSSDIIFMVNHVFKGGPEPCDICTQEAGWNCSP